jgi:MSHA biogenesis protein MshP
MKLRNRGFSLVAAIFLLVVVATLAAYIVALGTVQRQTSTLSILSARALAAAESGLEWAAASVLENDTCFAAQTFTLSGGAAAGFEVSVSCDSHSYSEGPNDYEVFRLQASADLGSPSEPGYVRRTLRASITTAP